MYLAGDGFSDQPFHFGRLGTGIARHDDGRFDDKRSVFLLSQFAEHLRGRLGVPCRSEVPARNFIAILFEGSTDTLGALSGKLGKIPGVEVKSLLFKESTSQWVEP